MTQKDKELVLKDICSRLPYNIKCYYEHNGTEGCYHRIVGVFDNAILANGYQLILGIDVVKLYLRSFSSMTEEEKKEYRKTQINKWIKSVDCTHGGYYTHMNTLKTFDWLNAHHFDYRGLIERDLAIEVDKDFYK